MFMASTSLKMSTIAFRPCDKPQLIACVSVKSSLSLYQIAGHLINSGLEGKEPGF